MREVRVTFEAHPKREKSRRLRWTPLEGGIIYGGKQWAGAPGPNQPTPEQLKGLAELTLIKPKVASIVSNAEAKKKVAKPEPIQFTSNPFEDDDIPF